MDPGDRRSITPRMSASSSLYHAPASKHGWGMGYMLRGRRFIDGVASRSLIACPVGPSRLAWSSEGSWPKTAEMEGRMTAQIWSSFTRKWCLEPNQTTLPASLDPSALTAIGTVSVDHALFSQFSRSTPYGGCMFQNLNGGESFQP